MDTLNDILRTSGYIFEIISNNKKLSNLVTGPNNQLIPAAVTLQLSNTISKFDQALDESVSKFKDARWCVEQIIENKQKQKELKLHEEMERQKRAEAERKRKEEEEASKRKLEEEEKVAKEKALRQQQEKKEQEQREQEARKRQQQLEQEEAQKANVQDFEGFLGEDPGLSMGNLDIPNPSDILSSITYKASGDNNQSKADGGDLDLGNFGGKNDQFLGDLNMDLLDQDIGGGGNFAEEEFDVDNFLNQFGGAD